MPFVGVGELAGLGSAFAGSISTRTHAEVGHMIGPVTMTIGRAPLLAFALLLVPLLWGAEASLPGASFLLMLGSGFLGISLGDPLFFIACERIGPRLTVLVQSFSACCTAVLGYFFLSESLGPRGVAGMLVATLGIIIVLTDGGVLRPGGDAAGASRGYFWGGVACVFACALGTAVSYIFLKQALSLGTHPLWAGFLRYSLGAACLWAGALARGILRPSLAATWTSKPAVRLLFLGCLINALNINLMPIAVKHTHTGVAAMLIGLQPVCIILIMAIIDRRLPSMRGLAGTGAAVAGTALLFLR